LKEARVWKNARCFRSFCNETRFVLKGLIGNEGINSSDGIFIRPSGWVVYMNPHFVSYVYRKRSMLGMACCQLNIENRVIGWDSILTMISEIRRLNPEYTDVAILNWRRFEDPE
jgi:hypothetical protein